MARSFTFCFSLFVLSFVGCANEPAVIAPVANEVTDPAIEQQADQDEQPGSGGIGDKVADLLEKAKSKAPTLEGTKQWFSDAGEATGQTTEDSLEWLNDTYKSLSDQGLTTAKDAGSWVTEDWNSMGAWEYKVVSLTSAQIFEDPSVLEATLNENGKSRWDCFHITEGPGGSKFYMKRQKRSYLKNLPLKDVLKLVPLLNTDGGGTE
jgi:hypothetical protein